MQRCSAIISPVRYRFVFTRAPVVSCYRDGASTAEPGATCRLTMHQTLHVTALVSHPHPCSLYTSQYLLLCIGVLFVRLRTTASRRHRTTMECDVNAAKTDTVPSMPTSKIPGSPGIPIFSSIHDTQHCLQEVVEKAGS